MSLNPACSEGCGEEACGGPVMEHRGTTWCVACGPTQEARDVVIVYFLLLILAMGVVVVVLVMV